MSFLNLSKHRSKKMSESGLWVPDEEATNCYCCNAVFGIVLRKHHCRACGNVVCGACSQGRLMLQSSRTGKDKRMCDKCVQARTDKSASEPVEVPEPTAVSSGVVGAALGVAGSQAGFGSGKASGKHMHKPAAPAEVAGGAETVESAAAPAAPTDLAVKDNPFHGSWQGILVFHVVHLGPRPDPALADFNAFKPGQKVDNTPLQKGSKLRVTMDLETKGAAYFKGTCAVFNHFGKDAKITGSIQRATGKVNMTVQVINPTSKVTTSFNFTGMLSASGIYQGSFSGFELSKQAGQVAGIFKFMAGDDTMEHEEDADAGAEEAELAAKAASAIKLTNSDSDSDSDSD